MGFCFFVSKWLYTFYARCSLSVLQKKLDVQISGICKMNGFIVVLWFVLAITSFG